MNFGYVTVNGVNSNTKSTENIFNDKVYKNDR